MACMSLTASASWYASRVFDVSSSGILCYGGSNSLFVYQITEAGTFQFKTNFAAHTSRLTSVALCKKGSLSCSSAEDGRIRVHDLERKKVVHEHLKHKVF